MIRTMLTCLMAFAAGGARAHGAHGEVPPATQAGRAFSTVEHAFGREGHPAKIARTVDVDMNDKLRFAPAALTLKHGETVRFRVKNSGKVMHEMVLGTLDELKKHAELMAGHPNMAHDEPYTVQVAPGKTETMLWHFTKAGEFYYGCLVPGHLEAGMIGRLNVLAGKPAP